MGEFYGDQGNPMWEMNFDSLGQGFSIAASSLALISTTWFWLVRVRRESPSLAVEPVGLLTGQALLPQQHPEAWRAVGPKEHQVLAAFWMDVAIVNNSVLPNAVLEITAEVNLKGQGWTVASPRLVADNPENSNSGNHDTRLPVNVSPMTTARLPLELAVAMNGDLSDTTNQQRADMAMESLADGASIRLNIKGVRDTAFAFSLAHNRAGKMSAVSDIVPTRRAA